MADFDFSDFEMTASEGMDAVFKKPVKRKASHKVRVASLRQLEPFVRLSAETLINKSERDLWSLRKEADGALYIERLFDDNGSPLKG